MSKYISYYARAKPIIGLDLHGVILDDGKLKERVAEIMFAKKISAEEFTANFVVRERGLLTSQEYRELQNAIYGVHYIGNCMPLVKGVKKYLPLLAKLGKLVAVTSNYGASLELSKELLFNRYNLGRYLEIHSVPPGFKKSHIVANMHLDFYLDDDPYKLEDLIGLVANLYLFTYKHNSHFDCSSFAVRVDSISSFYHLIRGIIYEGKMFEQAEASWPKNFVNPLCD